MQNRNTGWKLRLNRVLTEGKFWSLLVVAVTLKKPLFPIFSNKKKMEVLTKIDALMSFIDRIIDSMPVLTIKSICVYPIKSCAPLIMNKENDSCIFTKYGFKYDRLWMIINAKTKKKITQREYPKLALIKPMKLTESHLTISIDQQSLITIDLNLNEYNEISNKLTEFIGIDCELIKNEQKSQSWDKYPLFVVFQESLNKLNEKIGNDQIEKYDYLRFRPNILFTSFNYLQPFDEDYIKYLQLNQTKFICDKNLWSDNCLNVTCVNYKIGETDKTNEPKNTLKQWRNSYFGLGLRVDSNNLHHDMIGIISVGDKVTAKLTPHTQCKVFF